MKLRFNPFHARLATAAFSLVLGTSSHAANYWFDNNGTTAGFGVANGASYNWLTGTQWTTDSSGASAVAGITWPGGSNLAAFIGAGAATSYNVTLGALDDTSVSIGNLVLNSDGTNATAIGSGDVVIGGVGSTGTLSLGAANSIGSAAGTLTINSKYDLGASRTTNFRGGTVIINGVVSGTGTSGVALASGAFGLTTGTLTLAGNNTFAGNTSVASGYTLVMQHANALGATGGTNTVQSGGSLEVAGGIVSNSGEAVTINGSGINAFGALRAGSGGGTWAGQVTLGDTAARLGATTGNTLTVTGSIVNGVGTALGISGQGGTGVVILNPTTSNTYTGATNIVRGILRLGKNDALPTGTILDVDSASSVTDAATFDLAGFNQTVAALQDTATLNINGKITNSIAATTSTLTVNQTSNTIFDSIVENGSGTVVLTKGGAGSLTLNGANTYTGGTNIRNGSIIISGGNDRLATGGSIVLGDVATSGKLVLGDATTARNQTLAGLTTSGLGGSVVGAHATNNSTLTLAIASGTNTFAGTLGGGGTNENKLALTKTGAGTLNLTGANTYSGPTTLSTGTTLIGVASVGSVGSITSSALGTGGLTFNGGSLSSDSTSARTILNALTFASNVVLGDATNSGKLTFGANAALGAASRTITANSDIQFDGTFSNSAVNIGWIKAGTGTMTLGGDNSTFAAGTAGVAIQSGSVVAKSAAALGAAGQIVTLSTSTTTAVLELATDTTANAYVLNIGSGNTATVVVNRATSGTDMTHTMGNSTIGNSTLNFQKGANVSGTGTLEFGGITMSAGVSGLSTGTMLNPTTARVLVSGNITRTGGSANLLTLDGTSSNNLVSGIISGSQALTKSNVSTWELSNANTFTGITKVNGGTLKLTHALAIQSSAFDPSGAGTLDISTINTPTFGGLTGATSYALPGNVSNLSLNPGSGTVTYSGNLSGGTAGLTLTKTGTSTQILSGTNSYSGLTTVNGGELRISNAGAIGGNSVTVTSGQLSLDGGITVSGKTLTTSGSGTNFFGGLQSVTGTNTWSGDVVLGTDGARMGARKNATLVVSGAIDDGSNTFGLVIRNENQNNTSGGGNANTITEISGVNTYGGNTQVIAGVTRLAGGDNRLPTGTILQLGLSGANAKFDLNGRSQEVAGLAVASTTTDTQRDWNANELTNSSLTPGTLTVNTSADQTFGLTTTAFSGSSNYTGIITGNIALVKSGSARLTLSGANTYTNGTSIKAGSLVLTGGDDRLLITGIVDIGDVSTAGKLVLGDATAARNQTLASLTTTGLGGSVVGANATTNSLLTLNIASGTNTFGGILGGGGTNENNLALTKTGTGMLELTGTHSYSGATTVTGGTLIVNGNISTSTLTTVQTGATLGGGGSVGALTIDAGGFHNPGNSPGIMNTGDYTLAGTLNMEISGTTPGIGGYDQVNVTGAVNLSGILSTSFTGGTYTNGNLLFILLNDANDTITGTFFGFAQDSIVANYSGYDWAISYTADSTGNTFTGGNDIALMAVPEPGAAALLGGLGTLALLRRRRVS